MPWLVLLSAAALYLSLGQGALYGDGPGILLELNEGRVFENTAHYLHGPLVVGTLLLLNPLGFSLYQAALVCSALGTAVGVLCVYLASRKLLGDWRPAAWIAAMVATCPGVVFYATVVELHGPFFAFCGLVALALTNLALRPTMGNAVVLGVSTAVASLAHATGHLLPVVALVLCPVLSCGRGTSVEARRWLMLTGVVCLVHLTLAVSVLGLLRLMGLGGASVGFAAGHLLQNVSVYWHRLVSCPKTFLYEWLLPFFPVSIACVVAVAVADAGARRLLAGLYLLVAFYVLPTAILVDGNEFGAYFLPFAWPAAILATRMFSPQWLLLFTVLGLCMAVPRLQARETIHDTRRAVAAIAELQPAENVFLLAVTRADLELYFVGMPDADFVYLAVLAQHDESEVRASLPVLDQLLGHAMASGQIVLLTEAGRELLLSAEAAAVSPAAAIVAAHLMAAYRPVAVRRAGFRGWQLTPLKR